VASVGLVLLGGVGVGAIQLARSDDDAATGTSSPAGASSTAASLTPVTDAIPLETVASGETVAADSTTSSTLVPPAASTTLVGAVAPPSVDAAAYAVYDPATETWLAESGADDHRAVGSVMKLLTARVVLDTGDLAKVVTVPELSVDSKESAIGLVPGEQFPRDVLFRAMLIVSANDAARSLAADIGGDEATFVDLMNQTAERMGLVDTHAANPVGLDDADGYSSARDMVLLATDLLGDPTFAAAVVKPTAKLHGQTFPSTNDLLGSYPGADGVKTGHTTQAGYCLIGSATRDGRRVIVAVLGSSSDAARAQAATDLLDWAFEQPA
jgi:D-alanyl-D-alanine carboxypeptidase (penicillin-binding protein 5/6)